MTDQSKLAKAGARGDVAKRILEDEFVIEAFEKIDKEIEQGWKLSRSDDDLGRHNAYLMHRLFGNFKQVFKQAIREGDFAKKELLRIHKETLLQKAKRKLNV